MDNSRTRIASRCALAALACLWIAAAPDAGAKSVTCHASCKVRMKVVDGKPAVVDDPIVIARGKTRVHVNWRAPKDWEFVQGGVGLKQAAPGQFEQWCPSDVDNDNCASPKVKGSRFHCLALNNDPGTFAYRMKLRNTKTGEEQEIDPTIVNQGR
ncbi:MAG TPA: hypothetical protein VGI14_06290 [Casimicrobiaceae bacterium]|jgi:hypothetical protein